MKTVVVDASVALKWFVDETGSDQARRLLNPNLSLIAPDLIIPEVCNAAWKLARLNAITSTQYEAIAQHIGYYFTSLAPLFPLATASAALASRLDHPVYDCFYLALSESYQAQVVTADRRLLKRVAKTPSQVLTIDLYEMDLARL